MNALPCGRTAAEVLHKLDAPPDAHELQCPWCHAERTRLKDLDAELVNGLRGTAAAPEHRRDVVDSVMRDVRSHLRPQRRSLALSARTGAEVRVTSLELADAVRAGFAADPEVLVVYLQVRPVDQARPHLRWHASCSVSVSPDSLVERVVQVVLDRVGQGVRSVIRADALTVDVTLEDVHGNTLHSGSLSAG